MNVIHLIEKIPFLELEIIERVEIPYMILLYLIDVFCTYRLCESFHEDVWTSFIPFYNWIVVFRHCWDMKAFHEYLLLEFMGMALPFINERFVSRAWLQSVIAAADIVFLFLAVKHALKTGELTLKAYGYDAKKYILSVFLFDSVLILAARGHYKGNPSLAKDI